MRHVSFSESKAVLAQGRYRIPTFFSSVGRLAAATLPECCTYCLWGCVKVGLIEEGSVRVPYRHVLTEPTGRIRIHG